MKNLIKKVSIILTIATPLISTTTRAPLIFKITTKEVLARFSGEEDLTMSLNISSMVKMSLKISVDLAHHDNHTVYYHYHETYKLDRFPIDISIPLDLLYRFNRGGIDVEFTYTRDTTSLKTSGTIYTYQKHTFNTANYKNQLAYVPGVMLDLNNDVLTTDEYFDFTDLNEYISTKENNILDISSITFNYMKGYEFKAEAAELHIIDYENVYPRLLKKDKDIVFPLTISSINNEISFAINKKLYVNTSTLDMTYIPLSGYTKTSDLYVPINKEDALSNNEIYIKIINAGYSLSDIKIPLNFYYNHHYVGECYNSDYCVHGGIRQ